MDLTVQTQSQRLSFQSKLLGCVTTKVNNTTKNIQLYKLDKSDKEFGQRLVDKLELKKLYTNSTGIGHFPAWKTLIKGAVDRIGNENVILAVQDNRPCGIMSFIKVGRQIQLTRLATWNIKPNNKVVHAGKALMYELFKFADENNVQGITLKASSIKPFGRSCKDFYSKLGFVSNIPRDSSHFEMQDVNFAMKLAQLENFFNYRLYAKSKNVNLLKNLTLNFDNTFFEKISKFMKSLTKKNSNDSCRHIAC